MQCNGSNYNARRMFSRPGRCEPLEHLVGVAIASGKSGEGATIFNTATLSLSLVNGFTPTYLESFAIIQNNGFPSFVISGSFSNGSMVTDNEGNTYALLVLPTEVLLVDSTQPVPEPATWLLLGVGAAGAVVWRIRRRR
jgi:PEP-CTERM motif